VAKTTILLTDEIPAPPALARLGIETLPVTIGAGNERTRLRFIQFFTANIRNRNTRRAYARAVKQFFEWTESRGLDLESIDALAVAAYIEKIGGEMARPSVKQVLAGIRQMFDYLVTGGILQLKPATSVRGVPHQLFLPLATIIFAG
jgi:site-specific recombinase XerD